MSKALTQAYTMTLTFTGGHFQQSSTLRANCPTVQAPKSNFQVAVETNAEEGGGRIHTVSHFEASTALSNSVLPILGHIFLTAVGNPSSCLDGLLMHRGCQRERQREIDVEYWKKEPRNVP